MYLNANANFRFLIYMLHCVGSLILSRIGEYVVWFLRWCAEIEDGF